MKEQRFVPFPLFLFREFFTDKEGTLNKILCYGLNSLALKCKNKPKDVARQLIYYYYHGSMDKSLFRMLQERFDSEILELDEDCKGFNHKGEFEPKNFSDDACQLEILENEFINDPDFFNEALHHYSLHLVKGSGKLLRVTVPNAKHTKEVAESIISQTPAGEPMPHMSLDLLFKFRDNEKTDFELLQFACYIAIKSILGIKKYVPTNMIHVLSRMLGYKSFTALPDIYTLPEINTTLFLKYQIRYHKRKLMKAIECGNWGIYSYTNGTHGYYVGDANRTSRLELAFKCEENKKKNKEKRIENEKNEAKEQALKELARRLN